jgi:hypothetical protein
MSDLADQQPAIEGGDGLDRFLQKASEDEAAATCARARYRKNGMQPLAADAQIRGQLRPGEKVYSVWRNVTVDRVPAPDEVAAPPVATGDLYLTSTRLFHLSGGPGRSIELDSIGDATISGERLLLTMRDGQGIIVGVDQPRLARVQLSAARAARPGRR